MEFSYRLYIYVYEFYIYSYMHVFEHVRHVHACIHNACIHIHIHTCTRHKIYIPNHAPFLLFFARIYAMTQSKQTALTCWKHNSHNLLQAMHTCYQTLIRNDPKQTTICSAPLARKPSAQPTVSHAHWRHVKCADQTQAQYQ